MIEWCMAYNDAEEKEWRGEKPRIRLLSIVEDTMVDGPGFRTAIYAAGCEHGCEGCHNPQSWDKNGGRWASIDEVMEVITADPFAHVTFTGGDPMLQAEAFAALAREIRRRTDKTIWCYTGFTFEALLQKTTCRPLLEQLDVLVDGRFIRSLRDESLLFRGSSNQRLIDVQASLKGEVTLWNG